MERGSRWLLLSAVLASFGLTGCNGSGGGIFGFLGGGDVSSAIASFFGGDGSSAFDGFGGGGGDIGLLATSFDTDFGLKDGSKGDTTQDGGAQDGGTPVITEPIATVYNPEPASIGLFGGGMVALVLWQRRRARKALLRRA